MINALPNFNLIYGTLLLGLALIAFKKISLSNSRLNVLPLRAHSTTNLDFKSRPHFHPAESEEDFFSPRNMSCHLNPLNEGQVRFREEQDFLNYKRGKSLPLPRLF